MQQESRRGSFASSRPWRFVVGLGLFAGISLLALQISGHHLWAQDKSAQDIQDELRKALDSLKKGPDAVKEEKKEPKPPVDLNPVDELRQAEEAVRDARESLKKDPKSEEARKALDAATKNYEQLLKKVRPNLRPFEIAPINPADLERDMARFDRELQQMFDQMQGQLQMFPFPMQGLHGRIGVGNRLGIRPAGDFRLGVRLDKPPQVLVDQLNLPADQGLVVAAVVPNSPAEKAGIQTNDIIMELGGKPMPADALELQKFMQGFKADEKVDVVVMRKGKKETLKNIELPAPQPEFPAQRLNNPRLRFQGIPNAPFPPEAFNNARLSMMSVSINNGEFTIRCTEDATKYTVVGTKDDGGPQVTSIEVDEDGKVTKASSLDKLDAKYRPTVEKMLKSIR